MTDAATSGPGPHQQKRARAGFGYGFAAYGIWGLLPLYFVLLIPATAYEIVALRIVFSLVVCLLLLVVTRSVGRFLRLFRDGSAVLALTVAGVLIAGNWLLYTVATTTGHTLEASLGYFINPLVAILLGVLVLHEKLRPLQWTAIAVGALAVVIMAVFYGAVPWLSLGLAFTFGFYGLVKSRVGSRYPALITLTGETAMITPLALVAVALLGAQGQITLASEGTWCPPSPIESITDRNGRPVDLNEPPCEQVVEPGLARSLAVAMSEDDKAGGTSAQAAGAAGWSLPMSGKTGTTESHRSAAFLGFTNRYAAATYAYNDGTTTSELCTGPLRQCGWGDLFGGMEPARTWYSAMGPVGSKYGAVSLPEADPAYRSGKSSGAVPDVEGMSQSAATSALTAAGFQVEVVMVSGTGAPYGTVTSTVAGAGIPGSVVTIQVADGSGGSGGYAGATGNGGAGNAPATGDGPMVYTVPGMPPITVTPPS